MIETVLSFSLYMFQYLYLFYIHKLTLSPLCTGWHEGVTKIDAYAFLHLVNDSNSALVFSLHVSTSVYRYLYANVRTFNTGWREAVTEIDSFALGIW